MVESQTYDIAQLLSVQALRGEGAAASPRLPTRLWHLGRFLISVANQPAALWWAAHQRGLHPDVLSQLEWSLNQEANRFSPIMHRGWRLLMSAWRDARVDPNIERYAIEARRTQNGWSTDLVRATVEMYRPRLTVWASYGTAPPADGSELDLKQIIRADADYPRPPQPLIIPPDHLAYAVSLFRAQIEHAIVLEKEINGRDQIYFDTTRAEDGGELGEDGFQLTGHLMTFLNMMTRLTIVDKTSARAEVGRWPVGANQIFNRLHIWAASNPSLLDPSDAAAVFLTLDEESFWTDQHERDFLFALRDRWAGIEESKRLDIEQRLLTGSYPWQDQCENFDKANAYHRLNRLQWLHDEGVQFSFNFDEVIASERKHAPDWQPRFAGYAVRSNVGSARSILTETNPEALQNLSLGEIISAAREAARLDFDSNVERRPFLGLAKQSPARALAVITNAMRKAEFAEREWAALLHGSSQGNVKRPLLRAIGHRLARLTSEQAASLAHPISEWLRDRGPLLAEQLPEVFQLIWDTLITALSAHPPKDKFRRADEGWVDEGLNRPAGRMADLLFRDPAWTEFERGMGLPAQWKARLDQLLGLPGDARRHAIAMMSPHTNSLYNVDPEWTESRLIVLAERDDADSQAFWGGYFWGSRTPQFSLYTRLKNSFLALARTGTRRRDHANKLAGMLLAGWGGDDDGTDANATALIPDIELREVLIHSHDQLRVQMLWYMQHWSSETGSRWAERLLPFLQNVWPRQSAVRTERTSGRLVDMALGMPDRFPEIVEAILPRVGPIGGASVRMGLFLHVEDGIAARHPRHLLDLLWAVLPTDTSGWPYGIEKILVALSNVEDVRNDPRLLELRRREQQR